MSELKSKYNFSSLMNNVIQSEISKKRNPRKIIKRNNNHSSKNLFLGKQSTMECLRDNRGSLRTNKKRI